MARVTSNGIKINDLKDFTQQCVFENCEFLGGKIFKIGRIAIFQIAISINTTNEWGVVIKIPNELIPISSITNGTKICGTDFWVYNDKTIKGALNANTKPSICGFYVCAN